MLKEYGSPHRDDVNGELNYSYSSLAMRRRTLSYQTSELAARGLRDQAGFRANPPPYSWNLAGLLRYRHLKYAHSHWLCVTWTLVFTAPAFIFIVMVSYIESSIAIA